MLKVLDRLEEILIASLIAGATLLIFVAVTHRYALDLTARYHFDAAYGVRTGIHVGVDVLVNKLPPRWRTTSIEFGLLAGAFFTGVVGTMGAKFVWVMAHTDQTSPDMEAPMWIVYLAIPLGSYLMSFRFLQVAWSFWRTGELPHHDATYVEGVEMAGGIAHETAPNAAPAGAGR